MKRLIQILGLFFLIAFSIRCEKKKENVNLVTKKEAMVYEYIKGILRSSVCDNIDDLQACV